MKTVSALALAGLLALSGCSFLAGAKDGALAEVTGQAAPGAPAGSSAADVLLYSIGTGIAGALAGRFFGRKKEPRA